MLWAEKKIGALLFFLPKGANTDWLRLRFSNENRQELMIQLIFCPEVLRTNDGLQPVQSEYLQYRHDV